jgi:tRNA pseudouridine55 synthase
LEGKRKKYIFGKRNSMVDGILLINKPKGITSYDVIRRLKPLFEKKQKIGHGGTLDPFATGLMIIMLGKGTKLFDTFQKAKKSYKVIGEFGYETDSYDVTGEKTFESDKKIEKEELSEVLGEFRGEILQMPPAFSAKRINGRRAYELAREKQKFELKPKKVHINDLQLTKFNFPEFELTIECSSGTYIRSLVVDIARELKTFATPVELCRESIGEYTLKDAVSLDEVNLERDVRSLQ